MVGLRAQAFFKTDELYNQKSLETTKIETVVLFLLLYLDIKKKTLKINFKNCIKQKITYAAVLLIMHSHS